MHGRRRLGFVIPGILFTTVAVALGCLALASPLAAQTVTEFSIPSGAAGFLSGIAAGSDGNLWFTKSSFPTDQIGRITPAGVITEFPIPSAGSTPRGITAGPDGNLWFTESEIGKIGRITTSGVITEFSVPTYGALPWAIAVGRDGNLWFTEPTQVFPLQPNIGRITPAGVVTEFPLPTPGSFPSYFGITAGPDGNLWFTEWNNIGRITTAGLVTEFPIPAEVVPFGIAAGPDGNLWFAEGNNNIGRITTAGVITEFPTLPGGQPFAIAAGPDGAIWFTDNGTSQIGRITTGPCEPNDTTLCLSGSRFMVRADFETREGRSGAAHAVALSDNSGYFWFFDPTNIEVVTKVLPYCADPFNAIWIFAAGLTNVRVNLTYTDTNNGTVVTKENELGVPFAPIQDTSAFQTCP
jgi:streptogramin lyase